MMRITENINEPGNMELLKELWQNLVNYFKSRTEEDIEKAKIEEENQAFIHLVNQAKEDWDRAKSFFKEVSHPDLIDLAIHRMEAAKIFYMYLLKEAKRKGISA